LTEFFVAPQGSFHDINAALGWQENVSSTYGTVERLCISLQARYASAARLKSKPASPVKLKIKGSTGYHIVMIWADITNVSYRCNPFSLSITDASNRNRITHTAVLEYMYADFPAADPTRAHISGILEIPRFACAQGCQSSII
jgi:hypothetical protein